MTKKIVKMKSTSTNVRYKKAKQRGTHFLLTARYIINGQLRRDEELTKKNINLF